MLSYRELPRSSCERHSYFTPASNYPSRSDTGHVIGIPTTGPLVIMPSSEQVVAGDKVAIAGT
jgi:hypothetical protein